MHVVVCGADAVGAVVALLLASEGHQVTVVDPRPGPGPDAGGPPLALLPQAVDLVSGELPGVARRLAAAGAVAEDGTRFLVHRALVSRALDEELSRTEGIRIERGVRVAALLTGKERLAGRPHVQGVLTDSGKAVLADLMVDAAGRDSQMVKLLGEVGAPRPLEEHQDVGFRLYTRRFAVPKARTGRARWSLHHFDGIAVEVSSAGRGSWSMTLCTSDEDTQLYPLAGPTAWSRAAALYGPLLPPLTGTPRPGVWVTPRLESSYRRFVVDGRPVATGTASVGDAWSATNPLLGLGPSIGLLHAVLLRNALRQGGAEEAAVHFDVLTEGLLSPLHHRITDWEEDLQSGASGSCAHPPPVAEAPDRAPTGLDATAAALARDLPVRFSAMAAEAAACTRTGPSRAELVELLAHDRSTDRAKGVSA
ncbi:FAD-dependent oxidoreductase [Streptomyces sp. NPDC090445]|uniref:FAD-dependent oxidoreductase n=1 Tax=Streptomyces sp. NPDC090445 TaxID=3365963 RepID=UPI00380670D7